MNSSPMMMMTSELLNKNNLSMNLVEDIRALSDPQSPPSGDLSETSTPDSPPTPSGLDEAPRDYETPEWVKKEKNQTSW